ncbi:GerMN domain-containing protein [Modestobacter italicus]|uniref:GerMN domain-containing protein n=1 Tax=Modestobacter italicus (strain DSM 44449 / CECT 9708 / BC 501) TaxID=2732864 RepID=UPI001C9377B9|nr:GerMN domain-containing protein [Modestobacter italicus]
MTGTGRRAGTRGRGGAATVLTLALALAGCGVPTGGSPATIAASDVPYDLASPSAPTSGPPATPAGVEQPEVYLVTEDGALVPRGRTVPAGQLRDRLTDLLEDLSGGPTPTELTERLSTALRPDTTLSVTALSDSTATIDIGGNAEAPSGRESRRTVGQIVLTATSLPGIESVQLTRAGEPVDAPLASGELTSRPVTAQDYLPLLTPEATSATPEAVPLDAEPTPTS